MKKTLLASTFALSAALVGQAQVLFNEISASTTSTDLEFVEFYSTIANADLSGFTWLRIESGDTGQFGDVTNGANLGTATGNLFFSSTFAGGALENGASTFLLVSNYTGTFTSTDLDTNDDGTFDVTPWDAIIDSVAINIDNDDTVFFYSPVILGPGIDGATSTFGPGGAALKADGVGGNASNWVRLDFSQNTNGSTPNTPYALNPGVDYDPTGGTLNAVPEPSTIAMLILGIGSGLLALRRRRAA